MSDPDPGELRALAAEWLRVADVDKETVRVCVQAGRTFHPVAAFHCQQAAEKLMKGFLVLANIDFRKTHNLHELGRTAAGPFPELASLVARWPIGRHGASPTAIRRKGRTRHPSRPKRGGAKRTP